MPIYNNTVDFFLIIPADLERRRAHQDQEKGEDTMITVNIPFDVLEIARREASPQLDSDFAMRSICV